jgi:hypothetical protein
MTDQPVTPDREALKADLGRLILEALDPLSLGANYGIAAEIRDTVWPLLTEALDRARQQGRDEAAAAIERHADQASVSFKDRAVFHVAARLARGADRKD